MSYSFLSLANTGGFIRGHDTKDIEGNPAGGCAVDQDGNSAPRFQIYWQDGPLDRSADKPGKPNGAFVEDVLEVCRRRLEFYQDSPFACEENAEAVSCIEAAVKALVGRRQARRAEGVEGKNLPHGGTVPFRGSLHVVEEWVRALAASWVAKGWKAEVVDQGWFDTQHKFVVTTATKRYAIVSSLVGGDRTTSYIGAQGTLLDGGGRDLADGILSPETWKEIIADMEAYETNTGRFAK